VYSVCSVVGFLAGNSGQSLGLFNPPFGNLQISASPLPTTHYPLPTTHYPLPTTHYPLPTTLLSLSLSSVLSVPLCFKKESQSSTWPVNLDSPWVLKTLESAGR